jgi:hypothetical protein
VDKEFIAALRRLQLQAQSAGRPLLTYLLGMAELEAQGSETKRRKLS